MLRNRKSIVNIAIYLGLFFSASQAADLAFQSVNKVGAAVAQIQAPR